MFSTLRRRPDLRWPAGSSNIGAPDIRTDDPHAGRGYRVKVAIFNVKYSPNLGDGVIAECLEHHLELSEPSLTSYSIDIAGRTGYNADTGKGRGLALRLMEHLPPIVRGQLVPAMLTALVRFRLRPQWRKLLEGCDVAVIGGGALLADSDRNFPIKLSNALDLCSARAIPVAIAHVGVSPGWSRQGRKQFSRALRQSELVSFSVRDDNSIEHFVSEFGNEFGAPKRAFDPGLLACHTYGEVGKRADGGVRQIGVCLTSPLVLRLHGDAEGLYDGILSWLEALVFSLASPGTEVLLFTNGSPEDESFADELFARCRGVHGVKRGPRFTTPTQLVRYISSLDGLVAHRLHACIVAYSYLIPAVGLAWDTKLKSFFESVERGEFVIHTDKVKPEKAARTLESAMAQPQDPEVHKRVLAECRRGIAELARTLVAVAGLR